MLDHDDAIKLDAGSCLAFAPLNHPRSHFDPLGMIAQNWRGKQPETPYEGGDN